MEFLGNRFLLEIIRRSDPIKDADKIAEINRIMINRTKECLTDANSYSLNPSNVNKEIKPLIVSTDVDNHEGSSNMFEVSVDGMGGIELTEVDRGREGKKNV